MKIIEQTPTQLTVEDRPILLWLIGLMIGVEGILAVALALLVPAADTISCSRNPTKQVSCEVISKTLLGQKYTQHIQEVKSASVKDAGIGTKHAKTSIQTNKGEVSLTTVPIWTARATVYELNKFLATPNTPTLLLVEEIPLDRAVFGVFGLIWLASGVYLLLSPIITSTFYKHPRQLRLIKQNLFSTKAIDQSISSPIPLQVKYDRRRYHLILDKLHLSNSAARKKHLEEIADRIRNFLE